MYSWNFMQVYYVPKVLVYSQASLPTIFTTLPLFRCIFLRERIDIVHAHQVW